MNQPPQGGPHWGPLGPGPAGQPSWGQSTPARAPQPPWGQPSPAPTGQPPWNPQGSSPAGPPRKRRGLLIASIVFAVVLLLCAAGGLSAFLLLRNTEATDGAPEPVAAVDAFMRAVYADKNATKAAALVCSEARDEAAIAEKVTEVERYATRYTSPRFTWSEPHIDERNDDAARVSTVLTMATGDEKLAEQRLTFRVVNKTGWWVCEVGG
jgi:hypothetical protein